MLTDPALQRRLVLALDQIRIRVPFYWLSRVDCWSVNEALRKKVDNLW